MKLRSNSKLKVYRLQVVNAPKLFLVDRPLAKDLNVFSWKYVPRYRTARATIDPKKPRETLHRFIARDLCGQDWVEVFCANNDPFDCRMGNLRPYRRDEEGARRAVFKNKRIPYKGVYFKKGSKKPYGATIRVNKIQKHLGYFHTAELAAAAYSKAWKIAHPNKV